MTGPLVSTEWLRRHLGDSFLRLADVRWYLGEPDRGRQAYQQAHIPGAVYVDLETDLSAEVGPGRHPLPEWDAFATRMGELGIGDDSVVVAYDDRGGGVAARLWWMLRAVGHRRTQVLDGGLAAWIADGYAVTSEVLDCEPDNLTVDLRSGISLDRDELRDRLDSVLVLDARAGERYRGEVEPVDPIAGHIPGAVSAPHEDNLGPDGRFLPVAALTARYRDLGVDGQIETVVYCGSGVTACHNLLAMEHAGLGGGLLYPGSWSDWSTAGFEVATGAEPRNPMTP
ncbi:MAG: sulfurtransferase [Acidimicrobiia bacterium]|nr:sulfurtransferase [Acidimicrobiia bacterium]